MHSSCHELNLFSLRVLLRPPIDPEGKLCMQSAKLSQQCGHTAVCYCQGTCLRPFTSSRAFSLAAFSSFTVLISPSLAWLAALAASCAARAVATAACFCSFCSHMHARWAPLPFMSLLGLFSFTLPDVQAIVLHMQ